ncbi:serine hydrolase domain-containing protein [Tsuneonella sp. HG222]
MRQIVIAALVAAALGLAGWAGWRAYDAMQGGSAVVRFDIQKLPENPSDWHGQIDYRAIDAKLAALAARPEMAGLAVAIIEDGELRFVRTYGVTDRSTGEKVKPTTVFRWASLSKTAAGTLAGKLAAEGKVDLTAPISQRSNTLRLPGGADAYLSLDLVLSQRTGLTGHAYDERLEAGEDPVRLRGELAGAPMQCLPGQCYTYQNIAFDAASEILGQAAKQPYAQAVEQRMFAPLGMTSARYGMAGLTGAKSWARPHTGARVLNLVESYWRVPAAAGVSSNIVDLARWMEASMGERPKVLSAKALALAHAPRVATPRPYGGVLRSALSDAHYGLGWRTFHYGDHLLAGHSGSVDGFRATMIFDPATHTGVVAMWNSNWGTPFRIPFAVLDSYYGITGGPDWLDTSDVALPR